MLDIDKVELEYISTTITQRQLAEKYQVSENHIAQLSMERNWKQKRREWKKSSQEKVKDAVQETLNTTVVKMAKRHYTVWTKLMDLVEMALDDYAKQLSYNDGTLKIAQLERIANILSKVQDGQKVAKGDDIEIKKLELMKEKLEIEKKKIFGMPEEDLPDDGFDEASAYNPTELWEEEAK